MHTKITATEAALDALQVLVAVHRDDPDFKSVLKDLAVPILILLAYHAYLTKSPNATSPNEDYVDHDSCSRE